MSLHTFFLYKSGLVWYACPFLNSRCSYSWSSTCHSLCALPNRGKGASLGCRQDPGGVLYLSPTTCMPRRSHSGSLSYGGQDQEALCYSHYKSGFEAPKDLDLTPEQAAISWVDLEDSSHLSGLRFPYLWSGDDVPRMLLWAFRLFWRGSSLAEVYRWTALRLAQSLAVEYNWSLNLVNVELKEKQMAVFLSLIIFLYNSYYFYCFLSSLGCSVI